MSTVVLLNPYGSDVTNNVNGTAGTPQLLNGTVMAAGDTLYTLPYDYHQSSAGNITNAEAMLDTEIRALYAAGEHIKIFGYSQGCQIIDKWIFDNAAAMPIPGDAMEVLCIGNADRKFGGFAYGKPSLSGAGYVGGLPAAVPWPYVDFARQYDGVADYPTLSIINDTLARIEVATGSVDALLAAVTAIADLLGNADATLAAANAVDGMVWVHNFYETVTPADANVLWYTDTNGARYGISPTYPVPMLAGRTFLLPALDAYDRARIELAYKRVFGQIPIPSQDVLPVSPPPGPIVGGQTSQGLLLQISTTLNTEGVTHMTETRFNAAATTLGRVAAQWRSDPIQAQIDLNTLMAQLNALISSYPHSGSLRNAMSAAQTLAGTYTGSVFA